MSYDNTNYPDGLQGNGNIHSLDGAEHGQKAAVKRVSWRCPQGLCAWHQASGHGGRTGVSPPALQGLRASAQEMKPIYDQTSVHLCHYEKVINIRRGKDISHLI